MNLRLASVLFALHFPFSGLSHASEAPKEASFKERGIGIFERLTRSLSLRTKAQREADEQEFRRRMRELPSIEGRIDQIAALDKNFAKSKTSSLFFKALKRFMYNLEACEVCLLSPITETTYRDNTNSFEAGIEILNEDKATEEKIVEAIKSHLPASWHVKLDIKPDGKNTITISSHSVISR